jgi:predicted RNA-binding Zn ribbon-like protein
MNAPDFHSTAALPEPPLIADHPALDLMNTVATVDGAQMDFWQSDADVLRWLVHRGLAGDEPLPRWKTSALLAAARSLREMVRALVHQRKRGRPIDLTALNAFLAKSASYLQLRKEARGALRLTRRYENATPEQLLAPLAESAAELLATGDFELVRSCDGTECTLWFYDRTKAHRRRWCSMAVCGNRHKVAAFRVLAARADAPSAPKSVRR